MKKAAAAALAAALVAAVAGAIAWAGGDDASVVHACVSGGSGLVRIPAAGDACRTNETAVEWNVQGPPGPPGPQGEPGPQGPAGPAGSGGASEPNARVVGFLRVETAQGPIDGEATAKGHEQWIEALGFDAEAIAPLATGGAGAGKVALKPIVITKRIDKSTPKLFQALVTGQHLPSVQLDLVRSDGKGGQETFYTVTLQTVLVSAVHQLDDGKADGRPLEQVTFDYQKIEISEGDGTASGGGPTA